jgi:hypothetical protein
MGWPLVGLCVLALIVMTGFIHDDWMDRSGFGVWAGLITVTVGVLAAPALAWYSLINLYVAYTETLTHRRMHAMWRGTLGFDQAETTEVYWLAEQPSMTTHPEWQPLSYMERHRVVSRWQGYSGTPVLQPTTIVQWIVTGEDLGLLLAATHGGITDEAMLGYLSGDVEERATFEFLVSLAYKPPT